MVRIIMDERERGSIREAFLKLQCTIQLETLEYGDYIIGDGFFIERKRGDDCVASICDNRFFMQLLNLRSQCMHPILILENPGRLFLRKGFNDASIFGALLYATYKLRIPIIPTRNESETASIVYSMAKSLQKEHEFHFVKTEPKPFLIDLNVQKAFIQGLVDIGEIKSEALLTYFHTPLNIFRALMESDVEYSMNGKPKKIIGPLGVIPRLGFKTLHINQQILKTKTN
jgi:ERCC4-type nuclease